MCSDFHVQNLKELPALERCQWREAELKSSAAVIDVYQVLGINAHFYKTGSFT